MDNVISTGVGNIHSISNDIANFYDSTIALLGNLEEGEDDLGFRLRICISIAPCAIDGTCNQCPILNPSETSIYSDLSLEINME